MDVNAGNRALPRTEKQIQEVYPIFVIDRSMSHTQNSQTNKLDNKFNLLLAAATQRHPKELQDNLYLCKPCFTFEHICLLLISGAYENFHLFFWEAAICRSRHVQRSPLHCWKKKVAKKSI